MSDLISRSALIEAMEKKFDIAMEKAFYSVGLSEGLIVVEEIINEQPSVEPPNGEWKQITDFDADNNAIFECSNCLHSDTQAKGYEVPFCWYCGARMKGE